MAGRTLFVPLGFDGDDGDDREDWLIKFLRLTGL
jgi:hypothetical protein